MLIWLRLCRAKIPGIDLMDIKGMRSIFSQRRSEFWVALITTLMVVLVGVEQGIILAIVLSLIDHTRRGYRPKNVVLVPAASGLWQAQPVSWFCLDASAVDDVDYSAAETLRSIYAILKEQKIRLVVAQVLGDVKAENRYHLSQLFGEDAFYETLGEVVQRYRQGDGGGTEPM